VSSLLASNGSLAAISSEDGMLGVATERRLASLEDVVGRVARQVSITASSVDSIERRVERLTLLLERLLDAGGGGGGGGGGDSDAGAATAVVTAAVAAAAAEK
jgi:hypothetical protein